MTGENLTPYAWLQQARDLIAQDQLDEVLRLLRSLLENSPQMDEVLHQSGRFAAIREQIRLGVMSHAEAALTKNQIRAALLELLREMETISETPGFLAEMERAIQVVNSKNVVAGSTITGQSVNIGDKTEIHHHYGGQPTPPSRSRWTKIGAGTVVVIGLLAGIAEITGYSLRDYWPSKEPAPIIAEPEKASPLPVPPPSEAAHETPLVKPSQPRTAAPRNHFESHDSSKQINIPDNQGTININQ